MKVNLKYCTLAAVIAVVLFSVTIGFLMNSGQASYTKSWYTSRLVTVHNNTAIPADETVNIQPPAEETWEVDVSAALMPNAAGTTLVSISYFDGTTLYGSVTAVAQSGDATFSAAKPNLGVQMRMRLNNTMYARITYDVSEVNGRKMYSYHGYKE